MASPVLVHCLPGGIYPVHQPVAVSFELVVLASKDRYAEVVIRENEKSLISIAAPRDGACAVRQLRDELPFLQASDHLEDEGSSWDAKPGE